MRKDVLKGKEKARYENKRRQDTDARREGKITLGEDTYIYWGE